MQDDDPFITRRRPAEEPPHTVDEPNADGTPIGDTGLRQVGEIDLGDMVVAEVEPDNWLLLEEAGITGEVIEEFAREFGIDDLRELADTLAGVARGIDGVSSPEWVKRWRGLVLEASAEEAHKHARLSWLVQALERELEPELGPDPIWSSQETARLRREIKRYERCLSGYEFAPVPVNASRPAWLRQQEACTLFALGWPALTGEEPSSCQLRPTRVKPGRPEPEPSRFYAAFARVCEIFELDKPSSGTVGGWLKKTARDRAEIWSDANAAIADGRLPNKPSGRTRA